MDDVEKRLNLLFDALNCETLSENVTDALINIARGESPQLRQCLDHDADTIIPFTAMQARDREAAATLHMELLTRGSQTDDIGLWMSGLKQLLMRL